MFALLLLLAGLAAVAVVIVAICAAVLLAICVTSSSMLVGILKRRVSVGLRAFHYQISAVLGVFFLECLAFAFRGIAHSKPSIFATAFSALIAGLLTGLVFAYALDQLAGFLHRRFFPTSTPPITNA
jgi:hypothetical protein